MVEREKEGRAVIWPRSRHSHAAPTFKHAAQDIFRYYRRRCSIYRKCPELAECEDVPNLTLIPPCLAAYQIVHRAEVFLERNVSLLVVCWVP